MTDGLGSVSYVYDTISRLESETRTFTGVAGTFKLDYAYNLAGEVTSVTGPSQFGSVNIGYSYDAIGRPTGVTGANYAGGTSYVSNITYRAFGMKQMSYSNAKTLSLQYDNRMRVTSWNVPGALGWNYAYNYFGENTGRATFASNLTSGAAGRDASLDRSYDYDHLGRLLAAYTGTSALAHTGQGSTWGSEGPYAQDYGYDVWGNITHRGGWGGVGRNENLSYTNNRQAGMAYDAAGNLVDGTWYTFSYDATGQQTRAACPGYVLDQWYDGDRLRGKKVDNGSTTYYLRSSVLGGQVVAELNGSGAWSRGYVYLGGQMVALQGGTGGAVSWVHQDPVTKSQRITDSSGNVVSTVDLDPFGGDTSRNSNAAFQPHRYTSYERDVNGADDAMMRRYNRYWARFDQPDPYDGSYNSTNPQSFNRYAYVQNDPVNFVDPSGLNIAFGGGGGETHCWFTHGYMNDVNTLLSAHCMTIGGGFTGDPGGPGGLSDMGKLHTHMA